MRGERRGVRREEERNSGEEDRGERQTEEAASTGEPDVVNVAGPVQWSGAQKKGGGHRAGGAETDREV